MKMKVIGLYYQGSGKPVDDNNNPSSRWGDGTSVRPSFTTFYYRPYHLPHFVSLFRYNKNIELSKIYSVTLSHRFNAKECYEQSQFEESRLIMFSPFVDLSMAN